jgi:hypothetical protein
MFNVEIGGVDIKDMHFTRKYTFTLIMQHLLSEIKQKSLAPKAQVGEGLKLKEIGNESIPNMTRLNKQKPRKLGGNSIALERKKKQ